MTNYLEVRALTKTFPGVVANDKVDFTVQKGTIHALVGENGAGKSTLMKILYGMYQPDEGEIFFEARKVTISNPNKAIAMGIGMVHQEFQLVPSLTVAENIALGNEPVRGPFIDRKRMRMRVQELLQQFKLQINVDAVVADLSVGEQQRVEILKLLYRQARLLILDEPTAVLTPQETDNLFGILRRLQAEGHTIILITHKLHEVKALCEQATILRHGVVTGVVQIADTSEEEIVALMMGRPVELARLQEPSQAGAAGLEIENLRVMSERGYAVLDNLSLTVRAGEIVGVAGVEGNGQSELVEAIAGLSYYEGQIRLKGASIAGKSNRAIRAAGLAIVPENRKKQGLNPLGELAENLISTSYYQPRFCGGGVLKQNEINQFAGELIARYGVKAEGPHTIINTLSGGNMQKVVLARELAGSPQVLVAAHPTRGLDVAAAQAVREELIQMRAAGVAVLLISADLDEILNLSDRILVIFEGRIAGEMSPQVADHQKLGLLMSGHKGPAQQTAGAVVQ